MWSSQQAGWVAGMIIMLCSFSSFDCNCTDSGFTGPLCDVNIDDCANSPCKNNATCGDLIKDYNCTCHAGYSGKNCSDDFNDCAPTNPCHNGTCYQRSDQTLYGTNIPGFPDKFSYDTAAGFVCVCIPGYKGENCSIDIDECEPKPCKRGTCVDGINRYTCVCPIGWQGQTCDEDINECALTESPCKKSSACVNLQGDYQCRCRTDSVPLFGGKNCLVTLVGCVGHQCQNGARCSPLLLNETTGQQGYECACAPGWTGRYCNTTTAASFDGTGKLEITNLTGDPSVTNRTLSLSFRTTIPDAILAFDADDNILEFYALEIVSGRLTLTYRTADNNTNTISGPTDLLNTSAWIAIELTIKPSSLNLTVINCVNSPCSTTSSLPQPLNLNSNISIGTFAKSDQLSSSRRAFVGCLRDLRIDGDLIIADQFKTNDSVLIGCQRTEVCNPNPCLHGGSCADQWTTATCNCKWPYYDNTCAKVIPAATLGLSGVSLITYAIPADKPLNDTSNEISFRMRTTKQDGFLMYMGDQTRFLSLEIRSGALQVRVKLGGTVFVWDKGVFLANAQQIAVQVTRNGCSLRIYYFVTPGVVTDVVTPIAPCTDGKMNVTKIYIGSLPTATSSLGRRRKRAVSSEIPPDAYSTETPFDGTLQDVQLGGQQLKLTPDAPDTQAQSLAPTTATGVAKGEVTSDVCTKFMPCKNSAPCEMAFYDDYTCACTSGWTGKNCSMSDFCKSKPCPQSSNCTVTDTGRLCASPVTLDVNQSIVYSRGPNGTAWTPEALAGLAENITFKMRTLVKADQTLVTKSLAGFPTMYIQTTAQGEIRFFSSEFDLRVKFTYWDGSWWDVESDVDVVRGGAHYRIAIDGSVNDISTDKVRRAQADFTQIVLGGSFTGCLDQVTFSGYRLPVFTAQELNDQEPQKFILSKTYDANYAGYKIGCIGKDVCSTNQCLNNATCVDIWNNYTCTCANGYNGSRCELNINDCVSQDLCGYGACRDGVASYACDCYPGYSGNKCDATIDNCQPNPCANSVACTNKVNDYTCTCPEKMGGKKCADKLDATCQSSPCKNGTCQDVKATLASSGATYDSYQCACGAGMEGQTCDTPIDYCKRDNVICANGGTCVNQAVNLTSVCQCEPGYTGDDCSVDIDECAVKPCVNGLCSQAVNSFTCKCNTGWQGAKCDVDIDECAKTPTICSNNGTCKNSPGSFTCDCTASGYMGWRGQLCDQDVPECSELFPCRNQARCVELPGDYRCECPLGFTDKNCSTNIDDCVPAPKCQNNGKCVDGINAFTCQCQYTGYNGSLCETNINECLLPDMCQNALNCTDLPGSYNCTCKDGYKGLACAEAIGGGDSVSLAIIIGPIVAVLILVFLIAVIVFLVMARGKRANRGVYSPSRHENSGSGVQMGPCLKPPPEERLI